MVPSTSIIVDEYDKAPPSSTVPVIDNVPVAKSSTLII